VGPYDSLTQTSQLFVCGTDDVNAVTAACVGGEDIGENVDLGGMSFTPGVYKSMSNLRLAQGTFILDAEGDPDAVFIFVVSGRITVSSSASTRLRNEAKAENVFWIIDELSTGENTLFSGNVLASTRITLGSNGFVFGYLFGQNDVTCLTTDCTVAPTFSPTAGPSAAPTGRRTKNPSMPPSSAPEESCGLFQHGCK
jgi:hypothetical protein